MFRGRRDDFAPGGRTRWTSPPSPNRSSTGLNCVGVVSGRHRAGGRHSPRRIRLGLAWSSRIRARRRGRPHTSHDRHSRHGWSRSLARRRDHQCARVVRRGSGRRPSLVTPSDHWLAGVAAGMAPPRRRHLGRLARGYRDRRNRLVGESLITGASERDQAAPGRHFRRTDSRNGE